MSTSLAVTLSYLTIPGPLHNSSLRTRARLIRKIFRESIDSELLSWSTEGTRRWLTLVDPACNPPRGEQARMYSNYFEHAPRFDSHKKEVTFFGHYLLFYKPEWSGVVIRVCNPCPPVFETTRHTSPHRPLLLLSMSKFLDKVKKKVKKTADIAVDKLRPSQPEDRATSAARSQQSDNQATQTATAGPIPSAPVTSLAMTQSPIAPIPVAIPRSELVGPPASDASSPILETSPPAAPAYAISPSPTTILATTGSAVKGLLVAARDGSDLFLPLKAALVGVVALWDLFDVCHFDLIVYSYSDCLQRTVEAKAEFTKLESKLGAFKAIADAHQAEPRTIDESLQARLKSLAKCVFRNFTQFLV